MRVSVFSRARQNSDGRFCAYRLAEGSLCQQPLEDPEEPLPPNVPVRCSEHNKLKYRYCHGCMGSATRECPHPIVTQRCGEPLCDQCEHGSFSNDRHHGRPVTVEDTAMDEMGGAVGIALRELAREGRVVVRDEDYDNVGRQVIKRLSTHTLLKVLSGLAAPRGDKS